MISNDVELAADRIRRGGLVAMPTETVYGLAADARQPEAVARIFEIKGRPTNHPLIVHLADDRRLGEWARDVPDVAHRIADACWPGPITMLLHRAVTVSPSVTGGRASVGIRVPAHATAQRLLELTDTGLAAPSANRFGKVSPTTAEHVLDDLGPLLDPGRDLILDGGASQVGVESTIVDVTTNPVQVLRHGAITSDDLARIIDDSVDGAKGPSRASGMLASHYAPACEVVPVQDARDAAAATRRAESAGKSVRVLDRTDDLVVAAQRLYSDLRAADRDGVEVLVVVLPPALGLGHALRDRISKAAAERPDPASRAD